MKFLLSCSRSHLFLVSAVFVSTVFLQPSSPAQAQYKGSCSYTCYNAQKNVLIPVREDSKLCNTPETCKQQCVPGCIKNDKDSTCCRGDVNDPPGCKGTTQPSCLIPKYCWCKTADGTCENHTVDAEGAPILSCGECNTYCASNQKQAVHCENTYIDYTTKLDDKDCKPKPLEQKTTGGASGMRLYNPLGDVTIFSFIGRLVRAVIGVIGAIALLMFVYGGIMWMVSGGVDTRVKKAKAILLNSTIGILLIFFSYTLVSLFFGFFNR